MSECLATGFDSSSLLREGLDWFGTRADRRGRGSPCVMQAKRAPVAMVVSPRPER